MKSKAFFCVVTAIIFGAGFSPDASEQKQGSWKLVHTWGMLGDISNGFTTRCELITIKSDSVDYFVNGSLQFSGTIDSLISKYYKRCTLSVTNDTLRLARAQECCDIPYSWQWVRYVDSLVNFDGKWRWIETVGGITGVSRTNADYFNILNINGANIINTINDSVVFSGKRNSLLFPYHGIRYTWMMTTDTLFAFQKPQCCDMPYISKWIRWVSGHTGVHVSNWRTAVPEKENHALYFDIRGRKIVPGGKSVNGIHLLYKKDQSKILLDMNISKQKR
jgi:hypothetical protein